MQQSTTITRLSPDTGKDLEAFEKELATYAEIQGRHNAAINKPGILDEFNALFKNHCEIRVQEKINQNQADFLPISGMVVAKQVQEAGDRKAREIAGQINEEEHALKALLDRKKETTPDLKRRMWRKVATIIVAVIAILEGAINYGALRNGGFSKGAAFSVAFALTLGLALTMHIVADFIKRSTPRRQLFIRTSLVLGPAFLLFLVLGKLRADGQATAATLTYQTGAAQEQSTSSSPLAIALISFFIYGFALLVSVRYARDKNEKAEDVAYERACREHDEVAEKINRLRIEKEQVEMETKQKVRTALETWELALARERHLESIAKKALETYAASNLRHRTDGVCPPFFSILPVCNLTKFFDKINGQ